jgi:hypothetical protein
MNCGYSKEILALYIEDDLPSPEAIYTVESHVSACASCRQYCDQLRNSLAFIKSRFSVANPGVVSQEMVNSVRRTVMTQIEPVRQSLGFAARLERFLLLGLRRPRYAVPGFALIAIVSASLLGQIRHSTQRIDRPSAVFVGSTLLCPTGYREWVFVGSCLGHDPHRSSDMYHNVYIDPAAYNEYSHSGKFPDGTVMVLETLSAETKQESGLEGSYEKDLVGLQVSVKDSTRFDSGWGFYDFTEGAGQLKRETEPLPQTAGCIACHRDKAATDHVFTQFYPVLRSGTAKL